MGTKSAGGCVPHEMLESYPTVQKPIRDGFNFAGMTDIASCGGDGVDVLKMLDKMTFSEVCLQYAFSNHALQVDNLMRKPSYGLMDRIDMVAVLKLLLPQFVDCVGLKWMQSTQYLC